MDKLVGVEQKMIVVSNGGQPLSGPKIQPYGDLLLEYVDGEKCIDSDNTSKTFSVSIILHCSNTDEVCYVYVAVVGVLNDFFSFGLVFHKPFFQSGLIWTYISTIYHKGILILSCTV